MKVKTISAMTILALLANLGIAKAEDLRTTMVTVSNKSGETVYMQSNRLICKFGAERVAPFHSATSICAAKFKSDTSGEVVLVRDAFKKPYCSLIYHSRDGSFEVSNTSRKECTLRGASKGSSMVNVVVHDP